MQEFNTQIYDLQHEIKQKVSTEEWDSRYKKVVSNLRKAENSIIQTKTSKFDRDLNNYQANQVYTWHQERRSTSHTKSILKNRRQ